MSLAKTTLRMFSYYLLNQDPAGADKTVEAYISSLHHPFVTSVPIYIYSADAEAYFDSSKHLAEEIE